MKIFVDGWVYTLYSERMPNKRASDKKRLNIWLNRELYRKLELYAQKNELTMTEIIVRYIVYVTADIELTTEDYENIIKEMRSAEKKG